MEASTPRRTGSRDKLVNSPTKSMQPWTNTIQRWKIAKTLEITSRLLEPTLLLDSSMVPELVDLMAWSFGNVSKRKKMLLEYFTMLTWKWSKRSTTRMVRQLSMPLTRWWSLWWWWWWRRPILRQEKPSKCAMPSSWNTWTISSSWHKNLLLQARHCKFKMA